MPKAKGYTIAKKLIIAGQINNIRDLLEVVDKTPFSRDIQTSPERFNKLIANPSLFTMGDILNMAAVLGVEDLTMINIIYEELSSKRRKRK
jgi:hypothetical protein